MRPPYSDRHRYYVTSVTPIGRIASATGRPSALCSTKVGCVSIVAGCDAAEVLQLTEHALDRIAVAIEKRREAGFPAISPAFPCSAELNSLFRNHVLFQQMLDLAWLIANPGLLPGRKLQVFPCKFPVSSEIGPQTGSARLRRQPKPDDLRINHCFCSGAFCLGGTPFKPLRSSIWHAPVPAVRGMGLRPIVGALVQPTVLISTEN